MNTNIDSLASFAAKSDDATRLHEIKDHSYRDRFQRDRDRILYSEEFRRLSGKTQVFITGFDDNMRNRLTHTLEVSQIAVTIAKRLGLNETLTEAIALGHDLGHTPFGHVGERTLNYILNGCFRYYGYNKNLTDAEKGFKHNLQGIRVASFLEDIGKEESQGEEHPDGVNADKKYGLNLTKYTLWGIMNHSSLKYKECDYCKDHTKCRYKNSDKSCNGTLSVGFYDQYLNYFTDETDWTFEAIIVAYADEIAQRHHDIEDGIYAGVIDKKNLCEFITSKQKFDQSLRDKVGELISIDQKKEYEDIHQRRFIREISRIIIDYYVTSYSETLYRKIKESTTRLGLNNNSMAQKKVLYQYVKDSACSFLDFFGYDSDLKDADEDFGKYLSHHILSSELAQSMDGKASYIIRQLVKAYLTNPQQLPDKTIMSIIGDWRIKKPEKKDNAPTHMTNASSARSQLKQLINEDDAAIHGILLRRICDYIAGMTDQYALKCFSQLYEANAVFYK